MSLPPARKANRISAFIVGAEAAPAATTVDVAIINFVVNLVIVLSSFGFAAAFSIGGKFASPVPTHSWPPVSARQSQAIENTLG